MSEYREKLQKMMLRAGRDAHPCQGTRFAGSLRLGDTRRVRYQRFYTVCEHIAYAAFLAGWALCIVCHI